MDFIERGHCHYGKMVITRLIHYVLVCDLALDSYTSYQYVMKYVNLALRIRDHRIGWNRREYCEHWREWGFYHDRVL